MATNWEQLAEPESQPEPPLFDPYYTVAVKGAFLGVKPASVPVLLELTTTVAEFTALAWDSDGRTKQWLAFPEMFRKPPAPLDQATFCVAIVEQAFFKELKTYEPLKRRVRRFEAGPPVRNMKTVFDLNELPSAGTTGMSRQKTASQPSNANAAAPSRSQAATGPAPFDGVVVGVIDDGLAFANERFCTYNAGVRASRIESFWGQDLAPNPKYGYGA
ncbi:MAG: hypothetical protein IT518_12570, partial [Burkholderiales bacterium]|nr:hypothetical protein [Burkholderiales bacterium]